MDTLIPGEDRGSLESEVAVGGHQPSVEEFGDVEDDEGAGKSFSEISGKSAERMNDTAFKAVSEDAEGSGGAWEEVKNSAANWQRGGTIGGSEDFAGGGDPQGVRTVRSKRSDRGEREITGDKLVAGRDVGEGEVT